MSRSISIVVPTTRADSVRRLIDHLGSDLAGAGDRDWEIVVVDNRVDDHEALDLGPTDPRVRVVREPVPSASQARNRGVAESTGAVIVFYDDDVVPQSGCTSALVGPIDDGTADATGGRVRLDAPLPPWLTPPLRGYLSAHDRGDAAAAVPPGDHVLSACMAVRRDAFDRVGGFDAALGPRPNHHLTNDDVAFCEDLQVAGHRIRYEPGAEVLHAVPATRLTRRYVLTRAWWQGMSDHRLDIHRGRPTRRRDLLRQALADVRANVARREPGTWTRVGATVARATAHLVAPLAGN